MSKVTKFIFALVAVLIASVSASAQDVNALAPEQRNVAQVPEEFTAQKAGDMISEAKPCSETSLKAEATTARKAPRRKAVTTASLEGTYVMTYKSLTSSLPAGGSTVTVTKVSDTQILLKDFYTTNVRVTATVDLSTGAITIPNQVVATTSSYGDVDIATMLSTAKPDRSTPVTGQINADGTITLDSWWGIFIVSGDYADKYMCAAYGTEMEKANANMHVAMADTTLTYDWGVIVTQTSKNVVTIKNFGNHGKTIELVLKSDSTTTVAQQLVWEGGSTMGDFYVLGADWTAGTRTTPLYGTANTNELKWGDWIMYSTNKYYTGKLTNTTITGNLNLSIPQTVTTEWEGEGTEASPYLIKTLDDLITLSDKVNNDTERNYGPSTYLRHTKSFKGKYFRVENDIDMSGYRFTPIGNSLYQRFAGNFDGNGKTLTGLDVSTGTAGYAGLFGDVDTAAVIKNLNMKDVVIVNGYYYTGAVAGEAPYATIENCSASGNITGYITTGGVVGLAGTVTNCNFTGYIYSTGGIVGGVAGSNYNVLSNCWAKVELHSAGSTGYTVGGVVGTVNGLNAQVVNSWATGIVDGSQASGLYVGGVAGEIYNGKMDACYSVADVYGYDSNSVVGGVTGVCMGSLSNSYATGAVLTSASKSCGGVTGQVRSYMHTTAEGTDTLASTVTNCYAAIRHKAEYYLYDKENEFRETLGTIYTGAKYTVENVYFDKQMDDYFGSTHYGKLTSELTSAAGPEGFPADKWVFTEGYYPRLKGMEDTETAKMGACALQLGTEVPDHVAYVSEDCKVNLMSGAKAAFVVGGKTQASCDAATISNGQITLNGTFSTDTLAIYDINETGIQPRTIILKIAPRFFDGSGTAEDPFQIKTKADLIKLCDLTSHKGQFFENIYFKQMNDIDLEYDTDFEGIACVATNQSSYKFAGIYDGDGHAIHRMYLKWIDWKVEPTTPGTGTPNTSTGSRCSIYKGFVGQMTATGVVKNLTMAADCKFETWAYTGAFVGYNYGTVENCKNYAHVLGYSGTIGGIVGSNNAGGKVIGCYNAGEVTTGYFGAGGICGGNYGTIEECQNVGAVNSRSVSDFQKPTATSKLRIAGGLVGSSAGGVIRNSVNAGYPSACSITGGIAASFSGTTVHDGNNDLYSVLSYGTVAAPDLATAGAIGGNGYNPAATFQNVYFDAQLIGLQAAANSAVDGLQGVSTARLTSGEALEGFSDSIWSFVKGQYPILKRFANEPLAIAAAQIVLQPSDDNQSTRFLTSDAALSNVEGTTWKLATGTSFTIDGNTLKVPTVTVATSDSLYASLNGFTRPIYLRAMAPIPLSGSGTEADPYQLHNADEWNALANYVSTAGNSLAGKYVKVMNDFSFNGASLSPIGADGVTSFGGIFDGNNCTISGISLIATATYQGAFGTLAGTAVVKDLTLKGVLAANYSYCGGFAGKLYGTLSNCKNQINVNGTAATVGGFAGYAYAGASFVGCVNEGAVSSTKASAAGFAGKSDKNTTFTDCVNKGNVTYTGTTAVKNFAGFVADGNASTYVNCHNEGVINGGAGNQVAGLQAYTAGVSADTLKMVDCYNTGAISGVFGCGGLHGLTPTSSSYTKPGLYIVNCYNTGDISATSTTTTSAYGCAGITGIISPNSRIENCYNEGAIVGSGMVYSGGIWGYGLAATEATRIYVANCYNKGGVIGTNYGAGIGAYLPAYTSIDNCYNTGEISATFGACGIGNVMGNMVYIDRCWNSGNCSTTKQGCGGLTGYGSYTAYISNSFNTGDINVGSEGYNSGGLSGMSRAHFTNCYNRGQVGGSKQVGGLVGQPYKGSTAQTGTSFYDCYNAGKVNVTDSATTGNLCGYVVSTSWGASASYQEILNTYYVTDFNGVLATDTIGGTAITVKELAALSLEPTTAPMKKVEAAEGAGWNYGDEYTFPMIMGMENQCAEAFAAAVVLDPEDTYSEVTRDFHLGLLEDQSWSSNVEAIAISGARGYAKSHYIGDAILTSTCGDFKAQWPMHFNIEASGINDTNVAKAILSETYYNVNGQRLTKPQAGETVIVTRTYTDGTTESVKILNK